MAQFKVMDAIFKKPAGMDEHEHISIKTMIENKIPFCIVRMVFSEKDIRDENKSPTGEKYPVIDAIIETEAGDMMHIYLDKKNLTTKFRKIFEMVESINGADTNDMREFFKLRFVETPIEKLVMKGGKATKETYYMYDIEDVE